MNTCKKVFVGVNIKTHKSDWTFEQYKDAIHQAINDCYWSMERTQADRRIMMAGLEQELKAVKQKMADLKNRTKADIAQMRAKIKELKKPATMEDFEHDVQASEQDHKEFMAEHPKLFKEEE